MEQFKQKILECLQQLKGSGKIASIYSADFIFPGLQVNSVGEITYPINEIQAKALIKEGLE